MFQDITFQYPNLYILLAIIVGLFFATLLYIKDKRWKEHSKYKCIILFFLRSLVISFLCILLLSPIVKSHSEEIKKALILMIRDQSKSMIDEKSSNDIEEINNQWNNIYNKLSNDYNIQYLSFGSTTTEGKIDTFAEKSSNLANALSYINHNYNDQNLGAIILATDGIYNVGKNPLYVHQNHNAPFYIIAHGDTIIKRDLSIANIFSNKITYLGDKLQIQVDVKANFCKANKAVATIYSNNKRNKVKLQSKSLTIDNNDFFTTITFEIHTTTPGLVQYDIELNQLSNESSYANNKKSVFVEVLDARQEILILANAPHPDIASINSMLSSNKNYYVTVKIIEQDEIELNKFNSVIFHNLPSNKNDIKNILRHINKANIPRMFIVGSQTNLKNLSKYQDVLTIKSSETSLNEIEPILNPHFNSFIVRSDIQNIIPQFPALLGYFGEYSTIGNSNVILYQKIKDIDTPFPLIAYKDNGKFKTAIFVGEGVWKWRMFNYVHSESFNEITDFFSKTIQYISKKEEKRNFIVKSANNSYLENEEIHLEGQLYNRNYELVNDEDVFIVITDANNYQYEYYMSKESNYYKLNIDKLSPDQYSYVATTTLNGNKLRYKGKFDVQPIQLEEYDQTAKHSLLHGLVNKQGGKIYYPNNTDQLTKDLLSTNKIRPTSYISTQSKSIINYKIVFWIILFFLTIEWFLRRYWGNY